MGNEENTIIKKIKELNDILIDLGDLLADGKVKECEEKFNDYFVGASLFPLRLKKEINRKIDEQFKDDDIKRNLKNKLSNKLDELNNKVNDFIKKARITYLSKCKTKWNNAVVLYRYLCKFQKALGLESFMAYAHTIKYVDHTFRIGKVFSKISKKLENFENLGYNGNSISNLTKAIKESTIKKDEKGNVTFVFGNNIELSINDINSYFPLLNGIKGEIIKYIENIDQEVDSQNVPNFIKEGIGKIKENILEPIKKFNFEKIPQDADTILIKIKGFASALEEVGKRVSQWKDYFSKEVEAIENFNPVELNFKRLIKLIEKYEKGIMHLDAEFEKLEKKMLKEALKKKKEGEKIIKEMEKIKEGKGAVKLFPWEFLTEVVNELNRSYGEIMDGLQILRRHGGTIRVDITTYKVGKGLKLIEKDIPNDIKDDVKRAIGKINENLNTFLICIYQLGIERIKGKETEGVSLARIDDGRVVVNEDAKERFLLLIKTARYEGLSYILLKLLNQAKENVKKMGKLRDYGKYNENLIGKLSIRDKVTQLNNIDDVRQLLSIDSNKYALYELYSKIYSYLKDIKPKDWDKVESFKIDIHKDGINLKHIEVKKGIKFSDLVTTGSIQKFNLNNSNIECNENISVGNVTANWSVSKTWEPQLISFHVSGNPVTSATVEKKGGKVVINLEYESSEPRATLTVSTNNNDNGKALALLLAICNDKNFKRFKAIMEIYRLYNP